MNEVETESIGLVDFRFLRLGGRKCEFLVPDGWIRSESRRFVGCRKMSMYGFEAMNFNVDGGYLEAIVRGYRSGLLTSADYNNLCQCETLDDIKMHLGATDYGPYLANGSLISLFV